MKLRKLVAGPIGRLLCLVLALALATGPTAQVLAQSPANTSGDVEPTPLVRGQGDTTLVAAPDAGKINLTYVTPQAVALAACRPHQLLTARRIRSCFRWRSSPRSVNSTSVFSRSTSTSSSRSSNHRWLGPCRLWPRIVKFAKPFPIYLREEPLRPHTQRPISAAKNICRVSDPVAPSFFMPDDTDTVGRR